MPMIDLRDGERLHVREVGRGLPVLMLHGLGMQGAHWLPFVAPHSRNYRFILPDMRGAGRSAHVAMNQRDIFRNHMEDLQDLVKAMKLDDFVLVGYSLGASTALHWLNSGGFRGVRAYLHIDQSPCIVNGGDWNYGLFGERQPKFFAELQSLENRLAPYPGARQLSDLPPRVEAVVMLKLAETFAPVFGGERVRFAMTSVARWPWLFNRVFPMTRISDLLAHLGSYRGAGHDYRQGLRESPVPVTAFVGMRSPLYHPEGQMEVARLPRQGDAVRFEKSGHVPMADEPVKFIRELGDFLAEATLLSPARS